MGKGSGITHWKIMLAEKHQWQLFILADKSIMKSNGWSLKFDKFNLEITDHFWAVRLVKDWSSVQSRGGRSVFFPKVCAQRTALYLLLCSPWAELGCLHFFSSLSSPLQSDVRNVVVIKSRVSGLQEVTCREQGVLSLPLLAGFIPF